MIEECSIVPLLRMLTFRKRVLCKNTSIQDVYPIECASETINLVRDSNTHRYVVRRNSNVWLIPVSHKLFILLTHIILKSVYGSKELT